MLLAYGFLKTIFEVFEKYKTSIDMITTSEVAVSLTIDNDSYLEQILSELNDLGSVEVDKSQTIICIVGNQITSDGEILKKLFNSINTTEVRMVSYGGSTHNISLLIATDKKAQVLQQLNEGLF